MKNTNIHAHLFDDFQAEPNWHQRNSAMFIYEHRESRVMTAYRVRNSNHSLDCKDVFVYLSTSIEISSYFVWFVKQIMKTAPFITTQDTRTLVKSMPMVNSDQHLIWWLICWHFVTNSYHTRSFELIRDILWERETFSGEWLNESLYVIIKQSSQGESSALTP